MNRTVKITINVPLSLREAIAMKARKENKRMEPLLREILSKYFSEEEKLIHRLVAPESEGK